MPQQEYGAEHDDGAADCCTQEFFNVGFRLVRLPGTDALPNHRKQHRTEGVHRRPADIIDGKGNGIRGNGDGAQGRNQAGHQKLAHLKQAAFQAVGNANTQHPLHHAKIDPQVQQLFKSGRKLFGMHQIDAQTSIHYAAQGGGKSGTGGTHVKAENKGGIAHNIAQIGNDRNGNGLPVFAHGPQDRAAGRTDGEQRVAQQGEEEIPLGMGKHIRSNASVHDVQNGLTEAKQKEHTRRRQAGHQIEQLVCTVRSTAIVPVADVLGCDYRAAHAKGREHGEKQPVQGIHQGYGTHGGFSCGRHHGGIHHAHQDGKHGVQHHRDGQTDKFPVGKQRRLNAGSIHSRSPCTV